MRESKFRAALRRTHWNAKLQIALRRLQANLEDPLVLGFWINPSEALSATAVQPSHRFIRIPDMSRRNVWSNDEVGRLLQRIAKMTEWRSPTVIVWGIRDWTNGHDLGDHFSKVVRVEHGLISGQQHRRLKTAFMLNFEGIYFDGTRPNDCESSLETLKPGYTTRSPLARALVNHIRNSQITKEPPPLSHLRPFLFHHDPC